MAAQPDIGLAARHYSERNYQATADVCLEILSRDQDHFDALHLLGVVLSRQDLHAEALPYLLRAAAVRADHAQLQTNLCNTYLALKRYDDAMVACQQSLRLAPDDPVALNNLGLAHKGLGALALAIDAFRRATSARWDHAQAWYNLATCLIKLEQYDDALGASRTARRLASLDTPISRLADITNEIGRALVALGRPQEALAECRRFLHDHPDEPSVRWNMSLVLLLLGQYAEGWLAYESRWGVGGHDSRPAGAVVLDPAAVAGKHVLLQAEQGRGDTLQFVRYAACLMDMGARVSLQVYSDLVDLLAAMPGVDRVVSVDDPAPDVDLLTPVMSLPLAFGTEVSSIPARVPYLTVPADRLVRWQERLGAPTGRRIGLAWSGSVNSQGRSAMAAENLEPLFACDRFEFYCLQTEIHESDRIWLDRTRPALTIFSQELGDFADTAALMSLMDQVITVDTAVAHLAGALALPVWIMLPFSPDFRWLLGRDDSPWYPTARLFRQPARGDWASVVRDILVSMGSPV